VTITIATWNINSVRLRVDLVARFLETYAPDVLCLQEIKTPTQLFPADVFHDLGYPHLAVRGQKGYHGVAIASRLPLGNVTTRDWCRNPDSRHVFATLPGGLELHNFYVPAGGDVPDPEQNEKFAFKLRFLRAMARWFRERRAATGRLVLTGDLNVAPLETDVWSHKKLLQVVTHTPVEVAHLDRVQASAEWIDAVRRFIPPEQRLYSWWSYRAKDWSKADKGRRLDHVWVTPPLTDALRGATVLREVRGWPTPSDHVPVVVRLEA
jgi:exodeoxyribonuclease-3